MTVQYLKVRWHHDFVDEPVLLLSEIKDGWEIRKVDVFRDGRLQRAGPDGGFEDTQLGDVEIPTAEAIGADPQFTVEPTSAQEFESAWSAAGNR